MLKHMLLDEALVCDAPKLCEDLVVRFADAKSSIPLCLKLISALVDAKHSPSDAS